MGSQVKFKSEISIEVSVEFSNEELALKFFTDSKWNQQFYDFKTLEEVAEHLASSFSNKTGFWDGSHFVMFIEGFGDFKCGVNGYVSTNDIGEFGEITLKLIQEPKSN